MTQMDVDEEDFCRLVQECSLYLLNKHMTNIPIKRTEIIKTLMNDASRKTQNEVLKRVKEVLKQVHGLNMLELNDSVKSYLLVNAVPALDNVELDWDEEEKKKMILLLLVLSVIYMNGDSIPERGLLAFLRKLQIITNESLISPFFGDVDRILKKDFTQQRYITYESVKASQGNDDIVYVIHWGPRAENEIRKEKVLEYVSQVFDCEMNEFAEQFANITTS